MIEFITGASGTGKSTLMFERIAEFDRNGMEQVVLVPEQYSTDFDKKLYAHIGAQTFNRIFSGSFSSIARQLFQTYGESERRGEYADEMARMILIYKAISAAAKSPDVLRHFGKRCRQPGFAEEMLKLITDMKHSGITPQQLESRAVLLGNRLGDKAHDVSAIYYQYECLMEEYGFKDNLDNIREAARIANLHEFFKGKCVCLDEFESFNGDQIDMLKVIISSAANVIIALRTDDVNAGEFTLFETVNDTYRELNALCTELGKAYKVTKCETAHRFKSADLGYLSTRIFRNIADEPENAPEPKNIRIFEARDMYSEAEYVCATIRRIIHEDKTLRFSDIAVISNNIESYGDVLKAAFARYDIPYFLSIEKQVNHTAVMTFFITLLDLMTARRFRSEQIFRLLKCGVQGRSLTEISKLENYCYKWGIEGDVWCSEFTAEDDDLEEIEELRAQTIKPLVKLKKQLRGDISAKNASRAIYEYICGCDAERNIAALMNRLIKEDRDFEAAELKRLWACLMDILDSTASTLGDDVLPFRELADIFRSMIGRITYSLAPQTLDSVMAASARTARLSSPRVIFVMGASEGDFPNQVSLHGLFSEGDKSELKKHGVKLSRQLTELIASERLIVYKALSTASERLYISYPRSDLSGQVKYAAQAVDRIMKMFVSKNTTASDSGMFMTEDDLTPDYYAVTLNSAYYHYVRDRSRNDASTASLKSVLMSDPAYRERVNAVIPRSERKLEYTVGQEIMKKLKGFSPLYLSATGVENYSKCHFMYFCSSFMNFHMPEKIDLDERIMGDLTHNCFCAIMKDRTKKEFLGLSYDQLSDEIKAEAAKYRENNMGGDFAKTPRFELMYGKLIDQLTGVFQHTQISLMESDFEPDAFELDIRKSHPVRLSFGDGGTLSFGGIIDRADVCEIDGKKYLRIADYKSSSKEITPKTLASGLNLQMLLYLFASSEQGGIYEGHIPAGVLYTPIQIKELDTEDYRSDGYNESGVNSKLKMTGLCLANEDVLNAMEKGIGGKYIPVKLKKDGGFYRNSSIITDENMDRLKGYVYGELIEMAESLYKGDIDAIPLSGVGVLPCKYCDYKVICGNGDGKISREPDENKLAEAKEILGKEGDEE